MKMAKSQSQWGDGMESLVLEKAKAEYHLRFNENHGADGKFTSGGGSSGGSGGSDGSSGSSDSGSSTKGYSKYTYSSDVNDAQPSVSYSKNVNTQEKQRALKAYTSGKGIDNYENINAYLNGKKDFSDAEKEQLDATIKTMDSVITGKTDSDMMVYRGIALKSSDIEVGDSIKNKGFTSTSANEGIANDFANYYGGSTIKIKVAKGTPAVFVGYDTGGDFDEAEMLFGRNAEIVITGKNGNEIIGELRYGN